MILTETLEFSMESLFPIVILLAISAIIPIILNICKIKFIPAFTFQIVVGMILGSFAVTKEMFSTPLMEGLYVIGMGFLLLMSGIDTDYSVIFIHKKNKDKKYLDAFKISWVLFLFVVLISIGLGFAIIAIYPIESKETVDFVVAGLLMAVFFSSTFASVVIPVIHEKGYANTTIGQIVCTYSTIAELFSIVALSIFMISYDIKDGQNPWLLLISVGLLAIMYAFERYVPKDWIKKEFDGFTQLIVRVTTLILLGMMYLSYKAGAEFILGAFLAGAILKAGGISEHALDKMESIGYGIFIPLFFILVGIKIPFIEIIKNPQILCAVATVFLFLLLAKIPLLYLCKYYKVNTSLPSIALVSVTIIVSITLEEHFSLFGENLIFAIILASALSTFFSSVVFYSNKNYDICREQYKDIILEPSEVESLMVTRKHNY